MKSLTLNNVVTQSSNTFLLVRCRSLAGSNQFQYEAMINNQWRPVTHKFVEFMWSIYYSKQRALVKINPLSYIVLALAKSSAKFRSLNSTNERTRSYSGFFVRNTPVHSFYGGLGEGVERLAGLVCAGTANLAQFTSISFAALVVSFINSQTRAVFMTTIPNEIAPNKTISIHQIDTINKKLLQAEAILHLLTLNSTAEVQINDNLVCNILWATSDLVADARQFLHNDKSKEVGA